MWCNKRKTAQGGQSEAKKAKLTPSSVTVDKGAVRKVSLKQRSSDRMQSRQQKVHFAFLDDSSTGASCVQKCIDKLQSGSINNYNRVADLEGASLFYKKTVYRSDHSSEMKTEGSLPAALHNELTKSGLSYKDNTMASIADPIDVLRDYVGDNKASVWISDTFPVDMNLPLKTINPCRIVQAYVLAENCPTFLLSIYDKNTTAADAEAFTVEVASLLTWRLLDHCHVDFLILACTLPWEEFSLASLQKKVLEEKDSSRHFYDGPIQVTGKTFDRLREAAIAVSQTTAITSLCREPEDKETTPLYLLDKDWFGIVSMMIEVIVHGDDSCQWTYTPKTEFKAKGALLEAVGRLGFTRDVLVITADEQVQTSIELLKKQSETEFSVKLRIDWMQPSQYSVDVTSAGIHVAFDCPGDIFRKHCLEKTSPPVPVKRIQSILRNVWVIERETT